MSSQGSIISLNYSQLPKAMLYFFTEIWNDYTQKQLHWFMPARNGTPFQNFLSPNAISTWSGVMLFSHISNLSLKYLFSFLWKYIQRIMHFWQVFCYCMISPDVGSGCRSRIHTDQKQSRSNTRYRAISIEIALPSFRESNVPKFFTCRAYKC